MRNEPWVWPEVGGAGMSGAGAVPLRSAQMMGQQKKNKKKTSGSVYGRMQPASFQFPTFRLGSVLPQMTWIILCKNRPDLIWCWLTVSGFGQTDLVQKQTSAQESSGSLLAKASKLIWIGCEWDPACLLGSVCLQVPRPTARRRRRCGKGGRPHVCPECGSQFARSGGLKVHMRIHTGKDKIVYCPLLKSYTEI